MAIFSFHADIVKCSTGRSSVAAAAYRAGEKILNEHDGVPHDYSRKIGVVHSEIMLSENAPREYMDRHTLWNTVEKGEKRRDAQTARTIDIALPRELDRQEQIEVMREYIKDNFVDHGMCADYSIHDTGDGNPHAHIMLTMRHVTIDGFGGKNRDWNDKILLEQWRENWANICNDRFEKKDLDERISHLSLEAQGIDREATIHVGVAGKHMEQRGLESDRARINREIIARNEALERENTAPIELPSEAEMSEIISEVTAEYIHEVKEAYVIADRETLAIQHEISTIETKKNAMRIKAEAMEERTELINKYKEQIEELNTKRRKMNIFESKKGIRREIQFVERSHEQANKYFERTYSITPEKSPKEIAILKAHENLLSLRLKPLQERLAPIMADREAFKEEYQKQMKKLLLDISRDNERILSRLEQLENEMLEHQKTLSNREYLAQQRSLRKLEMEIERGIERARVHVHDR